MHAYMHTYTYMHAYIHACMHAYIHIQRALEVCCTGIANIVTMEAQDASTVPEP
jgi:hypothetical protein